MKVVVDYVHNLNLSFGLYTCAGNETCVGRRPGSLGFWRQDAESYASWGVDWVKMDWCHTSGLDPREPYPLMADALHRSSRHIALNLCEWGLESPWEWGFNVAQSWRMGHDHVGTWASTKAMIRASAGIPASGSGRPYGWNDMDMLQTGNGPQAAHANHRLANMTSDEYVTEFSMWAISASPLIVTTPIMNCSSGTCVPGLTAPQRKIL